MTRVLVFTPDPKVAPAVRSTFSDSRVRRATSLQEVASLAREESFDFALADVDLLLGLSESGDHEACLEAFRESAPGSRVVVLTPPERVPEAVRFVREGAADYFTYPVVKEELELARESSEDEERLGAELSYLRDRLWQAGSRASLDVRSESMQRVLAQISQVAPTRSTVLLTGETGVGKSFLAKVIHRASRRGSCQMVSVHCGAIPDGLLESELFGHERGAFTGAERRKLGKFEIADGGTLFLDEIASISPAMQVKLLHVLQEKTLQRVGGEKDIDVDVRILAATNVDLRQLTSEGSFRKDLYYRLHVFPVEVPPLRRRREDIPILARTFLERLRRLHGKEIRGLHPEVAEALQSYPWPGNVRELENLLERAFILERAEVLTPESFPEELFEGRAGTQLPIPIEGTLAEARQRAVEEAERVYLEVQLGDHLGRIDATARAAGVTTRQLRNLMTKHRLRKEDFRR